MDDRRLGYYESPLRTAAHGWPPGLICNLGLHGVGNRANLAGAHKSQWKISRRVDARARSGSTSTICKPAPGNRGGRGRVDFDVRNPLAPLACVTGLEFRF